MNHNMITIGNEDALILIDLNNDFIFPDGKLFVRGTRKEPSPEKLIEKIIKINLLPFGYRVKITAGYHAGHIEHQKFGEHAVIGTLGQDWPEELNRLFAYDFELIKGKEEGVICSPVYTSRDYFDLIRNLRKQGIKRVFCAGLAYDHCLGESAIAFDLQDFEVFVVRDAVRSVGDPSAMKRKFELYDVNEIFSNGLQ
jgi:nicotinamidase/pyrazinamidase